MKEYNGLTRQLFEREFRDMLFSVYNFAEDEHYTDRLSALGYDSNIENLEFFMFDYDGVDSLLFKQFKKYVESELQNDNVVIGILLMQTSKCLRVLAIKPKNVNVLDILGEFKD